MDCGGVSREASMMEMAWCDHCQARFPRSWGKCPCGNTIVEKLNEVGDQISQYISPK